MCVLNTLYLLSPKMCYQIESCSRKEVKKESENVIYDEIVKYLLKSSSYVLSCKDSTRSFSSIDSNE